MLRDINITAQPRQIQGRKASRKLARLGFIPGVLYGGDRPPVNFQIDPRKLEHILHAAGGGTTLFKFEIEGAEEPGVTIIKDIQHDPLTGNVIHADLFRISMDREIHVKVPFHLMGTATGVKNQGGVLDFVTRAVDVSCLPGDIPERIDIDVSALEIGDAMRISDLSLSEKITIHGDPNTPIATVVAPAAEKAAAAEEAEAAEVAVEEGAEPEVIKKGKPEEEEGAKEKAPEKSD